MSGTARLESAEPSAARVLAVGAGPTRLRHDRGSKLGTPIRGAAPGTPDPSQRHVDRRVGWFAL